MISHLSNKWNNGTAFVVMAFGDTQLATGSGFFWSYGGRLFLVTNWHNLSGRNPASGAPLSPTGAIPDIVAFGAFKKNGEVDEHGTYPIVHGIVPVRLANDLGVPVWFEHPVYGCNVDLAALDITDFVGGLDIRAANSLEADAVLNSHAAQDVFIVGFPFGLLANAPVPIWKRGTIAVDPTFDIDNLPKMFVDTATREGMSGSVVIARHELVGRSYTKKDGSQSGQLIFGRLDVVIGIYSGRMFPDLDKAQLGVVWKRRAIEETVAARKIAAV